MAGWRVWLGLGTVYVVWGSTYLAIRVMVETMPPALGGGIRFALAGVLLYGWLLLRRGREAVRVTRGQAAACGVVGSLLVAGGNGLVTVAERNVPSGLAALLIASIPLWVIVYRGALHERIGRRAVAGVLGGFAGVALLLLPAHPPGGANTLGIVLLLVAAMLWAAGTVASPRLRMPSDPLVSTAVQMTIGGMVLTIAGLVAGEAGGVHFGRFSSDSVLAFAYLVTIGSLAAYSAYTWLLQNVPVQKVSTYAYVNPVIAVFLGWLILSEQVTVWTAAGAAVILSSVAFIVRNATPPPPADPEALASGARDRSEPAAV